MSEAHAPPPAQGTAAAASPSAHEAHEEHGDHAMRYYKTFGALMVLTFVTVAVAQMDLGFLNLAVAMIIACTKATLVILFFMHVVDSDKVIKVTVAAGFIWLVIMFVFTIQDYATRGWYRAPSFGP